MWAGDPLAVTHEEDNMVERGVPNNAPGLTATHQKTSQSLFCSLCRSPLAVFHLFPLSGRHSSPLLVVFHLSVCSHA